MGCDIHTYVEHRPAVTEPWELVAGEAPFNWRSYSVFGFLADVRNYSAVTPLAEPRGVPDDMSPAVAAEFDDGVHSSSWLSVRELIEFDYDQPMNDRRITRNGDGGVTGSPEEGRVTTYREFLGQSFADDVERLATLGDPDLVRVVFWFDN